MNFKKLTSVFLAAQLLAASANAATLSNLKTEPAADFKSAEIKGTLDISDGKKTDEVLIKILTPGYYDSDIEAALGDSSKKPLLAVDYAQVGEDLTFSKTIGLKDGLEDGRYYVYFSGANISNPQKIEMWYIKDFQPYVDDVKAQTSADALFEKLFKNEKKYEADPDTLTYDLADILSLKNDLYKDEICDRQIAKILFAEKEKISDWSSLKSLFRTATIIGNFETGNSSLLLDNDNNFKQKVFNAAESPDMAKAEKVFEESLTQQGCQNVIASLSGKTYTDISSFELAFANEVLFETIYNNKTSGYGHIPEAIEEYNSWTTVEGKTDFSSFLALSEDEQNEAANKILQSEVTASGDLKSTVSKAASEVKNGEDSSDQGSSERPAGGGGGGGGTGGGGNSYTAGGGLITKLEEESQKREDEHFATFSDMQGYEWAKTSVEFLEKKGIVSGKGDGTFAPEQNVTREEFAKMLVLTMGYKTEEVTESFDDVDINAWYAPYVEALRSLKITEGSGGNKFNVGSFITREEACTLIYRATATAKSDESEETEETDKNAEEAEESKQKQESSFSDGGEIADYAKEAVSALSSAEIVKGDENGAFLPKNNMTRAEAAVLFYRLFNLGGNV